MKDSTFIPPQEVIANAQAALDLVGTKSITESGPTALALTTARMLAEGNALSPTDINKLRSYHNLHPKLSEQSMGKDQAWQSWNCLHADTEVLTEVGNIKISELVNCNRSIRVWSYDPEAVEFSLQPITGWHKTPATYNDFIKVLFPLSGQFSVSERITLLLTRDHLLFTEEGWVSADSISTKNLASIDSSLPKYLHGCASNLKSPKEFKLHIVWRAPLLVKDVTSVRQGLSTYEFKYDLTVANNHNYIANGVLVHNCWGGDAGVSWVADAVQQLSQTNLSDDMNKNTDTSKAKVILSEYKPKGLPPKGLKPADACSNCEYFNSSWSSGYCSKFDFPVIASYVCGSFELDVDEDCGLMRFAEPTETVKLSEPAVVPAVVVEEVPAVVVEEVPAVVVEPGSVEPTLVVEEIPAVVEPVDPAAPVQVIAASPDKMGYNDPSDVELFKEAISQAAAGNLDSIAVYTDLFKQKHGTLVNAFRSDFVAGQSAVSKPTYEQFYSSILAEATTKFTDPTGPLATSWIGMHLQRGKATGAYA